ncbi:DUF6074 family protein [Mesorhizobium sp. PUT5]|uniref:DUF6074 family protein n=1 Tax=Mesorhizobium sp. PUT5 TaxID=3454629 RepID=UPI003FA40A11
MQGSLFDWTPPCRMIVFPMSRRVGRIRDVAVKMLDKPTDRAATFYRDQVTDGILKQMVKARISEAEQDEQLGAFWQAVQAEMIRLTYCGHGTGGGAA